LITHSLDNLVASSERKGRCWLAGTFTHFNS